MEREITKKKILVFLSLYLAIATLLFLLEQDSVVTQAAFLTEEEVKILQSTDRQELRFGYFPGQELNFKSLIQEIAKTELGKDLQFVEYPDYETLQDAAIKGEVDFIYGLFDVNKSEELQWFSLSASGRQRVITNRNHPLTTAVDLEGSHVGLLEGSLLYRDFQNSFAEGSFEMTFFDSVEAALEAVENQEIVAFLTRGDQVDSELIHREQLQVEHTFHSRILKVDLATNQEDIAEVLEVLVANLSPLRVELFIEEMRLYREQDKEVKVQEYIQEKYQQLIRQLDYIEVGFQPVNFPYSFFDDNGEPTGVYGEMLDLFQSSTGIPYHVRNSHNETLLDQLFDELSANEIQFLLGVAQERQNPNITKVGMKEIQNNIISIEKYDNKNELKNFSELTFGVVTTQELASLILGESTIVSFCDYEEAVEALLLDQIDVLIARESMLSYYRDIAGIISLSQTDHINRLSSNGIMGNRENEELNDLMADIERLYPLLYGSDIEVRWANHKVDYLEKYALLREKQQNIIEFGIVGGLFLGTFWLVKREKETRRLRKAAERDSLTKLYNKSTYEKKCQELIQAFPDTLGIFFFIDLDDFKRVNDEYGHAVGDAMLIRFSEILENVCAQNRNTICFRIAGDEFGVFSIGYQTRSEIMQLILEIKRQLKGEVKGDAATSLPIKYSSGGSIYNLDTSCFINLKKYADFAMYQAKKKKGDIDSRIELFNLELLYQYHRERLSQDALELVLENRGIYPVYQPICQLPNNEIYGYEGLSRCHYPNVANIMTLIEQAEAIGRLDELDLLMMEQVILGFNGSGKLFINMISKSPEAVSIYFNRMAQTAEAISFPMGDIVIELSERIKWDHESIKMIMAFKNKYHFMIALDDFGVGMSGNALLLDVNPEIVKVDRYFINKIYKDERKYALVKFIINYIKSSNMKIACEGIEVKEELDALIELGSDLGQGYYLGKPE